MMILSPAFSTSFSRFMIPSITVGSPPLVRILSTPKSIKSSRDWNKSFDISKALWNVTGRGLAASIIFLDLSLSIVPSMLRMPNTMPSAPCSLNAFTSSSIASNSTSE